MSVDRKGHPMTAVLLAGSRGPADRVAAAAGVRFKALAPVAGRPMIERVLEALAASACVDRVIITGLPEPERAHIVAVPDLDLSFVPGADTPVLSLQAALAAADTRAPVLVTTADHALLTAEIVAHFCREAAAEGADVTVALARSELVTAVCPETRRTVIPFREGGYCGCNLFLIGSHRGREAIGFWRRVEARRKRPVQLVRVLGLPTLLRFLLRRLSLSEALAALSRRAGAGVAAVLLPFGEAAIDVDSPEDLRVAEALLARRQAD
jgi:GTP:adenosylcobinamide-phosphate guanylyltransferase